MNIIKIPKINNLLRKKNNKKLHLISIKEIRNNITKMMVGI